MKFAERISSQFGIRNSEFGIAVAGNKRYQGKYLPANQKNSNTFYPSIIFDGDFFKL